MSIEIQRADLRLRRFSVAVLLVAMIAGVLAVMAFSQWMTTRAMSVATEVLIDQVRHLMGIVAIVAAACVALLAGYAARRARDAKAQQRWPLAQARVLRDTPVRRGAQATQIARLLNIIAMLLIVFALATAVIAWRLFAVAH